MQSFRAADRQVGGGHLYATVVQYLQAEVAPCTFGVDQSSDRQLGTHILASLSHLAHHRGKPTDALRYARQGSEGAGAWSAVV
ncbi:hypothetical protein [Micromonospora sp. LOL_021]|uniref:hypothetical protein n=1 Tax=Micromonospora sp. LOL_021 TaxID=3345417 RepID=UPI003A893D29